MQHPDRTRELTGEEAALVFRRAVEIEGAGATDGRVLDAAALEEIARDVGLSAESVRRALLELRAGALVPAADAAARRRGSVPTSVTVARAVDGRADFVRASIERFLKRQLFEPRRRQAERSLWRPRRGMKADLMRRLDFNRKLVLDGVSELSVTIVSDPEGRACHVRFDAALSSARSAYHLRVGAGAGVGTAGAVGGTLLFQLIGLADASALLAMTPAAGGAALVGATAFTARRTYLATAERVEDSLELLLDELS